ncbi:MAG: type II secretion system protein GspG [Candidatus Marinimicrobia bacterium]|nr:type II secretion system protein GspG [Candidatus Neomarinimicrobiota bacterium]MCF7830163.1 type II secretion system protein GspG [Candidatus Neomarinimicrobiota bacterium]MCF7882103.1 type II secretion system protein GspG [Candidatus Neomarinimicrobiota bacterium]
MKRLPNIILSGNRGFTLFQLIGVLVAVAIVATLALQVVAKSVAKSNYTIAKQEMVEIGYAIAGNPQIAGECGYVGDVGALPSSLMDLIKKPADVCDSWNGPYLDVTEYPNNPEKAIKDPWNNEYGYDDGTVVVYSNGPNGVDTLLTYKFASSEEDILNNDMTISFNRAGYTPYVLSGCDTVPFTKVNNTDNQWIADGLTKCPGDIFYIDSNGDKQPITGNENIASQSETNSPGVGIIQYVNSPESKKADVYGGNNHIVDYTAENTGDVSFQIRQMRITWESFGNYWGPFQPKLASATVEGNTLFNHVNQGEGARLNSGGIIHFGSNEPFTFTPGQMDFTSMVFQDVVKGDVYNVDMRGTRFTIDYWPINAGKQSIAFEIGNYGIPGQIQYVTNSLVTGPEEQTGGEETDEPLTDYFILVDGDIDIAGNHHNINPGDIHSNSDITINGNTQSTFCGNVTAVGTFSSPGRDPAFCNNTPQGNQANVELPTMGEPWSYDSNEVKVGNESGNYTLSGSALTFEYDVIKVNNGSLTISDATISGSVIFDVSGNVNVRGDLLTASEDDEIIILAGGNVTTSGGNTHTVNASIHADGAAQISGNSHTFEKLIWVDGSAQISGNSNVFNEGFWAGGSIQYTNTSGSLTGLLWSGGSTHIAASDHDFVGGIIAGGDLDISGSRLGSGYNSEYVVSPIDNSNVPQAKVYELDFTLKNGGETKVFVKEIYFDWHDSEVYLTEAEFGGVTVFNSEANGGDRLSNNSTLTLDSPLTFGPGKIAPNLLHGFYDASTGGDPVDMEGISVEVIFKDPYGNEYPIAIPVSGLTS